MDFMLPNSIFRQAACTSPRRSRGKGHSVSLDYKFSGIWMKSRAQKQARWYLYLATSTHVCRGFWICMKTLLNKNNKIIVKQIFFNLKKRKERAINGGNCYYLLNVLYKKHRGGTGTVCLGGGRRKNKCNRTAHWDKFLKMHYRRMKL